MIWLALFALFALGGGVATVASAGAAASEWLQDMRAAVAEELPQLGAAARALVVAHAAYESGFGRGRAAVRGFNVFNITAGSAWTGASWVDVGGDTDGEGNRITQTWRAYPSLRAAVADYWSFLGPTQNRGRYLSARSALQAGDLEGFARALSAAGYFTLQVDRYIAGLTATHAAVS